jgi:hypothetical protein
MNTCYEIAVSGLLPPEWEEVLGGLEVSCLSDGRTLITGVLQDQAALYGFLMSLRDWGMTLISVTPIDSKGNDYAEHPA